MRRCLGTCARALGPLFPLNGAPVLVVLMAAACVPNSQHLWPALTGELAADPLLVPAAIVTDWPYELSLNTGVFQPAKASATAAGDTRISERLREIRGDLNDVSQATGRSNRRLQQLRGTAASRSSAYVDIVARIDDELRAGPAPGDPALQRRWRQALSALDRLASDDPALLGLVERISADGETAIEIAENVRSGFDLSGATDAERRATTGLLRDAEATAGISAAMMDEAGQDLATKRAYVAAERANMQILRLSIVNGESYGVSLANRPAGDLSRRVDRPAEPKRGDSPLVVIRFDDDQVRYAQPLYRAVSLALERRVDTLFTVVAVGPEAAMTEARDRAEDVRQTLVEMGLPSGQFTVSDWVDPAATGAEVHLYVR